MRSVIADAEVHLPPTRSPEPAWVPVPVIVENSVSISQVVIVESPPEPQQREAEQIEETVLYDSSVHPAKAGFDFSKGELVSYDDEGVDMYLAVGEGGP